MAYLLQMDPDRVFGVGKFRNAQGNTECVTFVRMATGAPHTSHWHRGVQVKSARPDQIPPFTAIATFDADGHYPVDGGGRHAAIYVSHDARGIVVLDQWNAQGEVKRRVIRFDRPAGTSRSNDGNTFHVIV